MIRSTPQFSRPSAFTLVELMISIALVLLLVIGINQVFSLTSKTVGAGQASSAAQRDMRAAAKVMRDDFSSALTSKGPCFIIYSRRVWAFRNKQDQRSDPNGIVQTLDLQNTGIKTALPPTYYNNRSHRVDLVKFFARGAYQRQTGDPGTLVSGSTGTEAFVTYGHAAIADNTPSTLQTTNLPGGSYDAFHYRDPGDLNYFPNPNNQYASQFILSRNAMILSPRPTGATDIVYQHNISVASPPDLSPVGAPVRTTLKPVDNSGTQRTVLEQFPPASFPANKTIALQSVQEQTGFAYTAPNAASGATAYTTNQFCFPVESGRFDRGDTTIDQLSGDFAQRIRYFETMYAGTGLTPVWYRMYSPGGLLPPSNTDLLYRMQCNPFITRPLTSLGASQTTPQFVAGCSQFMVEFAGDFVTQDNNPASATYGQVLSNQPDGVTDFVVPKTPSNYPNYSTGARFPGEGIKQIRWYGLPRDTDGDGVINGYAPGLTPARTNNDMPDVVPVRDVMMTAPGATAASVAAAASYEKEVTSTAASPPNPSQDINGPNGIVLGILPMTAGGDYAGSSLVSPQTYKDASTSGNQFVPPDSSYLCIWEFGGPQMIRIVMTVDDPNGRLNDGQTFEYVFTLKK
jgi:type II secretory pathway pseudopilin PulG